MGEDDSQVSDVEICLDDGRIPWKRNTQGDASIRRKSDFFGNVEFDVLEEHPEGIFQKEHV